MNVLTPTCALRTSNFPVTYTVKGSILSFKEKCPLSGAKTRVQYVNPGTFYYLLLCFYYMLRVCIAVGQNSNIRGPLLKMNALSCWTYARGFQTFRTCAPPSLSNFTPPPPPLLYSHRIILHEYKHKYPLKLLKQRIIFLLLFLINILYIRNAWIHYIDVHLMFILLFTFTHNNRLCLRG